jgi:hypothetical protein
VKEFEENICSECLDKLKVDPFEFLSPEGKDRVRKLIIKKLFDKKREYFKIKICGKYFIKG